MTMEKKTQYMKKEADTTSIHYINATNDTPMNYDKKFSHKEYAPFCQRITDMYLLGQNMIQKNE